MAKRVRIPLVIVFIGIALSQAGNDITHMERPAQTWKADVNADFYQTIIDNNLFAPLGTVLNKKPRPGSNLKLIATFTRHTPADATAILENTATGEQKTVAVGNVIDDYRISDIQPKQVLIEKEGEPAIWKFMTPILLD